MDTQSFYDQWIELLKRNAPSLENPEEMTISIMDKIKNLPVRASTKKTTYWTGIVSGVAACGLFCLLIYELNRPLINTPNNLTAVAIVKNPLPEKIEDIPLFLKEKERRATAYRELRMRLAQNYAHLSSSRK